MSSVVKLGGLVSFRTGKLNSNAAKPDGAYPFFTCSQETYRTNTSSFDTECVLLAGNNANGIYPIKYFNGRFDAYQRTYVIESLNKKILLTRFLFYALRLQLTHLRSVSTGSATKFLTMPLLNGIEIKLPFLAKQERIVSILSAYDDLIENNTRRIAILEEMARRLFDEWFVRFRFPGHEDVPMVESELGLVPEAWVAVTIGDAASYVNRGLSPKYDDAAACLVINQKCIRDQRLTLGAARRQSKPVPAGKLLQFGDVLINSTGVGTLGRVAQVLENLTNCTADSHVSIVRAGDNCDLDYFGLSLFAQQAHFEAQGVGSTGQTELSRARIAETPIVLPPLNVQQQFGKLVRPMRNLAIILQNKNQNLRTTRDLLLPKLISGELDVSTLAEPQAQTA